MGSLYRFLIRISAFLSTEIYGILRQPLLVLTLVLGPFLILLLFGLGFRNEPRALRTLFVLPETESEFAQQLEAYVTALGPQLIYMGVTDDRAKARERLLRREVDVVAVIPPNAPELIRNSQQVVIELDHYEIDPFQVDKVCCLNFRILTRTYWLAPSAVRPKVWLLSNFDLPTFSLHLLSPCCCNTYR